MKKKLLLLVLLVLLLLHLPVIYGLYRSYQVKRYVTSLGSHSGMGEPPRL